MLFAKKPSAYSTDTSRLVRTPCTWSRDELPSAACQVFPLEATARFMVEPGFRKAAELKRRRGGSCNGERLSKRHCPI